MNAMTADTALNASADAATPASGMRVPPDGAFTSRATGMDIEGVRLQNIPHAFVRICLPRVWPSLRVPHASGTDTELSALRERRTRETAFGLCRGCRLVSVSEGAAPSRRVRRVRRPARAGSLLHELSGATSARPRASSPQFPAVLQRPARVARRHVDADRWPRRGWSIDSLARRRSSACPASAARFRSSCCAHRRDGRRPVQPPSHHRRRHRRLRCCFRSRSPRSLSAGTCSVWHVFVLATCLGIVNAFDIPARQSFVVEMVGRGDLMNAIALNSAMVNGARVLGPSVAGVLIAAFGEGWCFLLNGLSYIAVIAGLLLMTVTPAAARPARTSAVRDIATASGSSSARHPFARSAAARRYRQFRRHAVRGADAGVRATHSPRRPARSGNSDGRVRPRRARRRVDTRRAQRRPRAGTMGGGVGGDIRRRADALLSVADVLALGAYCSCRSAQR